MNHVNKKQYQHEKDFFSVLSMPVLTQGIQHQVDDHWLTAFRKNAIIPSAATYEGNQRLGFYYQWLWQQLIEHHPNYELVGEELQLQEGKRTLGAIDFLVYNKIEAQLEHWEVAIKFYLAHQHRWLGPNSADNLDNKIRKMVEHQLEMANHPAYQAQYAADLGQPVCQRLIVQGRLFEHFRREETGSDLPINSAVQSGHWCFQSQVTGNQLRALTKREWLTPPAFSSAHQTLLPEEITVPTQGIDENQQIWFIVPDHWPLHNRDRHLAKQ